MKPTQRAVLGGLVITLASQYSWGMNADPIDTCFWKQGQGPMFFNLNQGTVYVPRDAPPGTPIGVIDNYRPIADPGGNEVNCWTHPQNPNNLEFHARATVPIFSGALPPIGGEDVTGKILQTNVPGVGVRIRLRIPFNGLDNNSFHPIGGPPIVPYSAVRTPTQLLLPLRIGAMLADVTLVKTGPVPAGPHQLDGSELFSGHVSGLNRILGVGITGTIIQAQCSVSANPVSADPIRLGDWDTGEFTAPGFTTPAVPFSIALSNCETDTAGGLVTTAHIQLDGINGSLPVGPTSNGVFSLTSDSTAQGIGIQILKADGVTPVELSSEVPLVPVTPGNMALHFNARFYQTATSSAVRPGLAKGALSFTLTYK